MLSPDGVQLAQEGEGDQGVGSADSQVALDLLQLAQTGLQLGCNVICKNTGAFVRDGHSITGKHRLINQTEGGDLNRAKQSDGLRETKQNTAADRVSVDGRCGAARTLLTAASNLDDQVAVENGAASQILGRSYRVDGLVSHTQFRAKAGAWRTGQSAWIDKKGVGWWGGKR